MTNEEFNAIKWRLVGHLSMSKANYITYGGEWSGITITRQAAIRVRKNGTYGKAIFTYWVEMRMFKSKEEVIKYLNELATKGDKE